MEVEFSHGYKDKQIQRAIKSMNQHLNENDMGKNH